MTRSPLRLITTLALLTACEAKLPTSAEVQQMDVAAAERALTTRGPIQYRVDGTAVDAAVARGLAANRIASVVVARRRGRGSEIRITTSASAAPALAQRIVVADSGAPKRKFDGLLLIDGRITDASELDRIAPDRIESVEVIKGAAATQAFTDPRAANGVIKVTLKKS